MRTFRNINARDLQDAVAIAQEIQEAGQSVAFSGGGTDLLQQVKDGTQRPDVIINLRSVDQERAVRSSNDQVEIGGLISLSNLGRDAIIQGQFPVLTQAATSVGSPQIRNAGTLAGNIMQRPWCWYYRNGFDCFKAGGKQCYSVTGENQLHAIFGGGPSYIVHPSDIAPALVALDAKFKIVGPDGERNLTGSEFFVLPIVDPEKENVLASNELLAGVSIPRAAPNTRSAYKKVMDREAWTHAVVSVAVVLEMDGMVCSSARIVMGGVAPIPWRVPEAEQLLQGQRITPELARQAAQRAVAGAAPLAKNGYKVQMARTVVERTILSLSGNS
ncbi:MAG: FAD binding domain-containing protein [Pseudohongiellaceae bacterium]